MGKIIDYFFEETPTVSTPATKDVTEELSAKTLTIDTTTRSVVYSNVQSPKIFSTSSEARVNRTELEYMYITDPDIFNGINKILATIMIAGYKYQDGGEKETKAWEKFTEEIGNVGNPITFKEILEANFKHTMEFGLAFNNFIFNMNGSLIVDLDIFNPVKMDYAKDSKGNIIVNDFGVPLGFIQKINLTQRIPDYLIKYKRVPINSDITLKDNELFIPREKVGLIKLFRVDDNFYPTGILEPIYKRCLRKLNLEEALANAAYSVGFPIMVGIVGDEKHNPSPAHIDNLLTKITQVDYKGRIVIPYWEDIKLLESSKGVETLKEQLEFFIEEEATGLGIPLEFMHTKVYQEGNELIALRTRMFNITVKDIVHRVVDQFNKFVIKEWCTKEFGPSSKAPKLVWNEVGIGELFDQSERLKNYAKAGVLPEGSTEIGKEMLKKEGITPKVKSENRNEDKKNTGEK